MSVERVTQVSYVCDNCGKVEGGVQPFGFMPDDWVYFYCARGRDKAEDALCADCFKVMRTALDARAVPGLSLTRHLEEPKPVPSTLTHQPSTTLHSNVDIMTCEGCGHSNVNGLHPCGCQCRGPEDDRRDPDCVTRWPECGDFKYDPKCCRFPKSCSAGQR